MSYISKNNGCYWALFDNDKPIKILEYSIRCSGGVYSASPHGYSRIHYNERGQIIRLHKTVRSNDKIIKSWYEFKWDEKDNLIEYQDFRGGWWDKTLFSTSYPDTSYRYELNLVQRLYDSLKKYGKYMEYITHINQELQAHIQTLR